MSYEVSQIETVLTAKTDQHDKALDKSEKKLTDFGKGASDAGFKVWSSKISASLTTWGSQLSVGLTLPLTLLAKQIIDIGFSYEKAMNTFQAVTKSSTNEMAAAAAMAEKLGADMTLPATSAADAALAMTELAKGGFTAQQAMDAARGALQLAAAAQVSEAQAAEITANALNTFGLAASESTRVADLLAAASNASSAEITDVAQAMQQAGSSAAALHIPIQDLVTAIGEMANAGIKSSDAGTSLKTFMVALVPHTKAASVAMKELGINAFDSAGNFVGLQNVIQQAAPALARMTVEQKQHAIQAAFGTDAMRAANIVLGGGIEKFTAMSSAVNQSGAASELAAAKTKGLSGAWDGFLSQLETFGLKVFKSVSGSLEGLIRTVASAAEGFSKLDATVLRMGVVFATTAASAGPIALLIGKLMTLGPQGLAVTAVVAGAAAMSAAYSSNFGAMTKVVDDFFRLFTTNAKSFDGAGTAITKFALYAIAGLDALIETIEKVAVNIVQLGRLMVAAATGNWTSLAQIWSEGRAKLDRIDSEYLERVRQRQGQLDAIERGGAQGLMDYLRVINGEGGNRSGDAYFNGYVAADPFGKIEAFSVSKVQGLEGKLRSTGFAAGLKFGGALKDGAYNATHQSPFFMIHWLEDAAAYAQNEAPTEFGKAGSKMGEKLKSGFQSALGNINEFLGRAFGGTGTISDSILDIIIRKFPKAAEELQEQARFFHEVNEGIKLYSALLNTASGRNSEYVIKVNNALGSLLQFDKAMREHVVPEIANFDSKIGDTIIITQAMGEAIREAIGSLVTDTLQAPGKALKDQILLWANSGKAARDWGKTMSEAVKQAKDDIKSSLGEGIGGVLVSLADKFHWHLDKVKGWAGDVSNIIGTMPGKFGDAARKVASTLNQWLSFGNSVLSILNRVFGQGVPSSMDGLFSSIINIFKGDKATNQVGRRYRCGHHQELGQRRQRRRNGRDRQRSHSYPWRRFKRYLRAERGRWRRGGRRPERLGRCRECRR
jgi:TP901 family phage tail tape measure protein